MLASRRAPVALRRGSSMLCFRMLSRVRRRRGVVLGSLAASAFAASCAAFGGGDSSSAPGDDAAGAGPDGSAAATADAADAADIDAGPGGAVLLRDIPTPVSIAASGGTLVYADGTADLRACDVTSCASTSRAILATGLAQSKSGVAMASGTGIIGAFAGGCTGEVAVFDLSGAQLYDFLLNCPHAITAFGGELYVTNAGSAGSGAGWSVMRCDAAGCVDIAAGATKREEGAPLVSTVVTGKVLTATDLYQVLAFDDVADAGPPTSVPAIATALASDGTSLFWFDGKGVQACTMANCGTTHGVVQDDTTVRAIAYDSSGLYWTSAGSGDGDGKVMWLATISAKVVAIATGLRQPIGLALDDGFVYWANDGCDGCSAGHGEVRRVAKAKP